MGSHNKKTEKAKADLPPLPPRLDFEAWRQKFHDQLGSGEPSRNGLQKWINHNEEFCRSDRIMREQNPALKQTISEYDVDVRTKTLQSLYDATCPPELEPVRVRQRHNEFTLAALDQLASHAETFAKDLREKDLLIEAETGMFTVDLTPLVEQYETAARDSRYILSLARQPYTHDSNLVLQCVPLFVRLTEDAHATEPEATGLLKVALRAHGYDDAYLAPFSPRTGTLRKRAKEVRESFVADLTAQLYRKGKFSRAVLQPSPPIIVSARPPKKS